MNLPESAQQTEKQDAYWSQSLLVVKVILCIWFLLSLGCGVLFRDFLDASMPQVGGAPFGFWMAQQGSIIGFLVLLLAYMVIMNRMDSKYGYREGSHE